MKWFKTATDADDSPRLLSLSPLRHCDVDHRKPAAENTFLASFGTVSSDDRSVSRPRRRSPSHHVTSSGSRTFNNADTPPTKNSSCPSQSKRLPNCYDVQQGRIIVQQRPNRLFVSPTHRMYTQSPCSTFDFHHQPATPPNRQSHDSASNHIWIDRPQPLSSTRLSYAASPEPLRSDAARNLHKSLDDLLITSSTPKTVPLRNHEQDHRDFLLGRTQSTDMLNGPNSPTVKKTSNSSCLSARLKNMSARTHQMFQRFYPQSGDSSDQSKHIEHSRRPKNRSRLALGSIYRGSRSMSHGNMLDAVDLEQHDNTSSDTMSSFYLPLARNDPELGLNVHMDAGPEDSDSGILVNESGQSSIVDVHGHFTGINTDSVSINELLINEDTRTPTEVELNEFVATAFKIDGKSLPMAKMSMHTVSEPCSPIIKEATPPKRITQFQKNTSSYSSMSGKLFRRSMSGKQFESIDVTRPAGAINNLCDDEKLRLSRMAASTLNMGPAHGGCTSLEPSSPTAVDARFSTLPRRPKTAQCSFHTIVLEKGPGKKSLGFTIVGGTDSPKGALGIFIKTILPVGQAADNGRLRAGDEILAVNGEVCHDLSHHEAVVLFKSIRSGEVVLNVCRRVRQPAPPPAKKCQTFIDYI